MSLKFSRIISALKKVHSDGYRFHHLSERSFGGLVDPILVIDHFTMSEKVFAARPYAGVSTATYIFEDSPSGLLSRDSRGDRSEIAPGSLHWTFAGRGVLHEETPLVLGKEVRGIQLFVNLSPEGKKLVARSFHLARKNVPEWNPSQSVRGRVLVGRQGGVSSPVELPEPFTWIELDLKFRSAYAPRVEVDSGALIYVISGRIRVSNEESISQLGPLEALGIQSEEKHGELIIEALEDSRFFFFSGRAIHEPFVAHGTFVMNTRAQITEAIEAYRKGEMGRID